MEEKNPQCSSIWRIKVHGLIEFCYLLMYLCSLPSPGMNPLISGSLRVYTRRTENRNESNASEILSWGTAERGIIVSLWIINSVAGWMLNLWKVYHTGGAASCTCQSHTILLTAALTWRDGSRYIPWFPFCVLPSASPKPLHQASRHPCFY